MTEPYTWSVKSFEKPGNFKQDEIISPHELGILEAVSMLDIPDYDNVDATSDSFDNRKFGHLRFEKTSDTFVRGGRTVTAD